jgi:glucose-1-phosphate thymidylyltransferase
VKGIVLAGGSGTRLYPVTLAISKQLLPVYDKPLIYYPIGTLMSAGIRDISIVTTQKDASLFKDLLGDGSEIGVTFRYFVQNEPNGIPEAFLICEKTIKDSEVALILGDNIFFGKGLGRQLSSIKDFKGAHIFGHVVSDPERYGVAELNSEGSVINIIEKPENPNSNVAVTGLYFYDTTVLDRTRELSPSKRGELEITDLNLSYLESGNLQIQIIPRGNTWLDTGTFNALHDAANFVKVIEERQGLKISCLDEIAFYNGWISENQLFINSQLNKNKNISTYLQNLITHKGV